MKSLNAIFGIHFFGVCNVKEERRGVFPSSFLSTSHIFYKIRCHFRFSDYPFYREFLFIYSLKCIYFFFVFILKGNLTAPESLLFPLFHLLLLNLKLLLILSDFFMGACFGDNICNLFRIVYYLKGWG